MNISNSVLNWIIFAPDSMFDWIIKTYQTGLSPGKALQAFPTRPQRDLGIGLNTQSWDWIEILIPGLDWNPDPGIGLKSRSRDWTEIPIPGFLKIKSRDFLGFGMEQKTMFSKTSIGFLIFWIPSPSIEIGFILKITQLSTFSDGELCDRGCHQSISRPRPWSPSGWLSWSCWGKQKLATFCLKQQNLYL